MSTFEAYIKGKIEILSKEREALKQKSKELLEDIFKEFFKRNPEVNIISWQQYTPYFSVNFDEGFAYIEDIDYDDLEQYFYYGCIDLDEGQGSTYEELREKSPKLSKEMEIISDIMNNNIIQEALEDLGEGLVTVTERGFNIFDFDHD